ncbi:Epoxyqueuosine reductase [Tepidimonas alkaliphilus]|uniref:Epoxyqueuosine reductase n=1 Tax=Tepidimonas alkaliphilus TaxID=2588942 RepID=A0A554WA24_9BURK|nr:tRNA epoxyqueuosine(34) reductase QueG [Tepidimonas alkaliphilus]TSE20433.1 Epoxyqueuosine reductase [Tepidimonas alkaliphilus]
MEQPAPATPQPAAAAQLWQRLRGWARELGFSQIGVADIDLSRAEPGLLAWLREGHHGTMDYMARHGLKRARPAELVPGTVSVITARMDYLPRTAPPDWREREWARLRQPHEAVVSLYARGRDYHKVLRRRLQTLAERLQSAWAELEPRQPAPTCRVFADSAPVLEVELAARSGLGWRGKHTLLLSRQAGSMFFLGEIFIDRWLPRTLPESPHCGRCRACLEVCPTQAIVAPYRLDARRCISYLTIEHAGSIPPALRPLIGNRIYGCDDCQLVCPWNKFAQRSALPDFDPRHQLDRATLLELWSWTAADFAQRTEGSAIRRIGYERWRRNLAVALGNARRAAQAGGAATAADAIAQALRVALQEGGDTPMVREHILWALD